jgi:hypothetical protein
MQEKEFSIKERLTSPKPTFFKKAQGIGLALVALSASLAAIPHIPALLITILSTAGAAIAAVSQFAVKTYKAAG